MVLAWGGAAVIAMIIARYYKDGFINSTSTMFGLKPWFQVNIYCILNVKLYLKACSKLQYCKKQLRNTSHTLQEFIC